MKPNTFYRGVSSKLRQSVLVQGGFELLPSGPIYEIVVFQMPA